MATMPPLAILPYIRARTDVSEWCVEWNNGSIYYHNRQTNTSIVKQPPELRRSDCVDRLVAPWRLELSFSYRQQIISNFVKQISPNGCPANLRTHCYKIARIVEFNAFINADNVSAYKMVIGKKIYDIKAGQQQQQQQLQVQNFPHIFWYFQAPLSIK